MDAGKLDKRITIKKWNEMASMAGGITQSFNQDIEVWAKLEPVGNAIFFGTKQAAEDITHRVFVRRSTAVNERKVTAEHVVEHRDLRYRVKRASDLKGEGDFVLLDLELLGEFYVPMNTLLINGAGDRLLINSADDHLMVIEGN